MLLFQTENGSPGDFPSSVHYLFTVQTEICHLSVYEETNGGYPFAYGLNGLNGLADLCIYIGLLGPLMVMFLSASFFSYTF